MGPQQPLPSLAVMTRLLKKQHGAPRVPPPRTAFEWVLWENVAYLADDDTRTRAFDLLRASIGFAPAALLQASNPALLAVTRHGIVAPLFARKLRTAAELARDRFGGDLDRGLSKDASEAARQVRLFPGIGEPGAEKILVAIGRTRALPLDSNGLRVLLRIGYGTSLRSYSATYRSVQSAIQVGRTTAATLFGTHLLLQKHGREVCKNKEPRCGACQLRPHCTFGRARPI
jgi:endonuclease III